MASIRDILLARFQTRRGFKWSYAGELSDATFQEDPSGRASCKLCGHKIPKGVYRAAVTELNTRLMVVGTHYYHPKCFQFLVLAEQQMLQNKYNEAGALLGAPNDEVPSEIIDAFMELLDE